MKMVAIAILKNKLSLFLREVEAGVRLIITDHGRPVAKLVPLEEGKVSTFEEKMIVLSKAGMVDTLKLNPHFKKIKPVFLEKNIASQYVIEDRG